MPIPEVQTFLPPARLRALIEAVREEDMGPLGLDITSKLAVDDSARASAVMRARCAGVLCGGALLGAIAEVYGSSIKIELLMDDGERIEVGAEAARLSGPLATVLAMERVALNFACHLSGIASLTAKYVQAVAGTRARITDTRKTIPGLRGLAKYAVVCGGGHSHRIGLYDAVLVKDNHIAGIPCESLDKHAKALVERARQFEPRPKFVEIEVDDLAQLQLVLTSGLDIVLLDNMTTKDMREAVKMRDRVAPKVLLEASGGVTLETVGEVARTGVDRIAVGAITHSAPALDLGLDIES